ncbi:MAG: alpha/beta hydrolase [Micavibrio sp.]
MTFYRVLTLCAVSAAAFGVGSVAFRRNPMARASPEMKKILDALENLGPKPVERLRPADARKQPTPTDAVGAVLRDMGKDPAQMKKASGVTTKDITYPTGKGHQPARLYVPDGGFSRARPVIVYYHGGGFVLADLDVYDAGPRALAKKTGAIVVSVEYRHAPEHKFPAAHEDAFTAYQWALSNAAQWGGDPTRIAVAGESAGGNLAANVAIQARDKGLLAPAHMLLVYPVAGNNMHTQSYRENAHAKPLNKAMMKWFVKHMIRRAADKESLMINLVAADLSDLPPATIITAEIDPLRSEGQKLAERLKDAGNHVEYKNYKGVTHEFFGMDAVLTEAADAQDLAARNLRQAFTPTATGRRTIHGN